MGKTVIAAVQVSRTEFAAWFDGGVSKLFSADQFDIDPSTLAHLEVAEDYAGITIGDAVSIDADTLFDAGTDYDFVESEKRAILKDLSATRRSRSFSQTRLGEAAGIRQSVISRIEGCEIAPQINTLIKLLAPLGKTLAVVDIDRDR